MAQVTFRVEGVEKTIANIIKLQERIKMSVPAGLTNAADTLRDAAIIDLQGKLGTSWRGIRWGSSIYEDSIENKASWLKEYKKWNEIILTSSSPHSAIVELGGTRRIFASEYGHRVWPIGANQGKIPEPTESFALQRGYHYLTTSIHNPSVTNKMINEVARILSQTIAKAGI